MLASCLTDSLPEDGTGKEPTPTSYDSLLLLTDSVFALAGPSQRSNVAF